MSAPDLVEALLPVVEALEAAGATYRIGGSVASSALGVPRSTLDVDLVCDLRMDHVAAFVARLEADYFFPSRRSLQPRAEGVDGDAECGGSTGLVASVVA